MLLRKQIPSRRLRQAVIWLRPSCEFLDHHSQRRFGFMTQGVMRWVTLALCVVIALTWPALEILPMVTSIGAATLALLVYGLFTQDGVYVILGYAAVALSLAAGAAVI
jgi:hypothetical protein